jgi:hypothetical protein
MFNLSATEQKSVSYPDYYFADPAQLELYMTEYRFITAHHKELPRFPFHLYRELKKRYRKVSTSKSSHLILT